MQKDSEVIISERDHFFSGQLGKFAWKIEYILPEK